MDARVSRASPPWRLAFPRLWHMAWGWGAIGVAYVLAMAVEGRGTPLAESAVDRAVPFDVGGVWLYLSFFLLVPAGYLFAAPSRLPWLMRAMQGCALVSGAVFLLWPTTLAAYPPIAGDSLAAGAMRLLAAVDSRQNCVPSLHAALTALSVAALVEARRPWRSAALAGWGCAILVAILQTRRHLSIDIAAGLALAFACGLAARRLVR